MYTADYIIYFINAQHILNSLKNAKKITQTPYKFSILSFFQNTTLLLYFVPFLVRFHIYKPDFCPHHHLSIFQLSSCYDFNHHFFFGGSTIPLYTSSQFIFSKYSCSIKLSTVNLFTGFRRSNRIIISFIIGK